MVFRESTQKIVDRVGDATGVPVEVVEDPSLAVRATVTSARPGVPFHVVRLNPRHGEADYIVAFQCGFVLRQTALPRSDRWSFAATPKAVPAVGRMIAAPGGVGQKLGLPPQAASGLANQLASGLLTQLRSVPIGARVDAWIRKEYPDLADLQAASMRSQSAEYAQGLSPQIKRMSPQAVWKANAAMNAAYASFCKDVLEDRSLTLPYDAAGATALAKPLLDLLLEVPNEPAKDRDLVDAWGRSLGLGDWYEFVPSEDAP